MLTIEKIGYGMGKKDFPEANCVRAFLGYSSDKKESVVELSSVTFNNSILILI